MSEKKMIPENKFPNFCQWEITRKCGLGCEGCSVPIADEADIPKDIALKTVSYLADAGIDTLELIGGEPTQYSYLKDVLNCINNEPRIKRAAVLTNGINRQAIDDLRIYFRKEKIGLVVSINYTEERCEELNSLDVDKGMVKKSLAGWEILRKYANITWVRVNCVVSCLNVKSFPEIARRVIKLGGLFSFCPFVYKRQGVDSGIDLSFRSKDVGHALLSLDKEKIKKSIEQMKALKREFPDRIVPREEYIEFLSEACKISSEPYLLNCKDLGIPYLRVSSRIGQSYRLREFSPRLRACTDIYGLHFSQLTVADLKDSNIRNHLADWYQNDPNVRKCQEFEGCPWSVTFTLRNQK